MRRLLLLCILLTFLAAPVAMAQDPAPTPTPEATAEPEDDGVLDPDEVPPESTPDPATACGDEGADADYCDPCPDGAADDGADADYVYCVPVDSGGGGGPPSTPTQEDGGPVVAAEQVRSLPSGTLPYTGSEPLVTALLGLGFVLLGAGARLRLRPAAPRR